MYYLKRFLAFLIDFYIFFLVAVPLFFVGPNFSLEYLKHPSMKMFSPIGVVLGLIAAVALTLTRDLFFQNASIGKKIFKLKIVSKNGDGANKSQLIFRNIFCFLIPINGLCVLLSKRSLGDHIAQTKVID